MDTLTPNDVDEQVRAIATLEFDYEEMHAMEDRLHKLVLLNIANGTCDDPKKCARLALMTVNINFTRWYS